MALTNSRPRRTGGCSATPSPAAAATVRRSSSATSPRAGTSRQAALGEVHLLAWTAGQRASSTRGIRSPGPCPQAKRTTSRRSTITGWATPAEDRSSSRSPASGRSSSRPRRHYDGRWLVLRPSAGASNKSEIHALDLAGPARSPFRSSPGYENGYVVAEAVDGRLYLRTDRDAPLGRVIAVDLEKLPAGNRDAPFREVVPAGKDNLTWRTVADSRLVVDWLHNAADLVTVCSLAGRPEGEIALPGIGTVGGISGEPDQNELFLVLHLVHRAADQLPLRLREEGARPSSRRPKSGRPTAYETEQVWYPSKDGTQGLDVPRPQEGPGAGRQTGPSADGYGGFNISMTPDVPRRRLRAGSRRAASSRSPNLRGGGEYGEAWHQAGMLEKKQNVFDDFIAAAEWLIAERLHRPANDSRSRAAATAGCSSAPS